MYRQLILKELRGGMMRLRDPRCDSPHGMAMYLVGLIHGLRLGDALDERELSTAQLLMANASMYHYQKTPWPEAAPYLPF